MSMTNERSRFARLLDVGGRVILSVLAVGALFTVVSFAALRGGMMGGKGRGDSGAIQSKPVLAVHPGTAQPSAHFWPHFPGSGTAVEHLMVIDGENVVSEYWETMASASEVLDYYREQMASRGWHDVTESELGLEPETQVLGGEKNSLQNEAYLRIYEQKMETCLILRRDPWSMQIDVEPGSTARQRRVSFFAVSHPSVQEFSGRMAGRLASASAGTDEGAAFESSETSGGVTYETTMRSSGKTPEAFFAVMLESLTRRGWRMQIELPVKPSKEGTVEKFALLEGKDGYACLIVTPKPDGRGSSAIFTRADEK